MLSYSMSARLLELQLYSPKKPYIIIYNVARLATLLGLHTLQYIQSYYQY
jgi:hypothetical protein